MDALAFVVAARQQVGGGGERGGERGHERGDREHTFLKRSHEGDRAAREKKWEQF